MRYPYSTPWQLPESAELLTVSSEFVRDILTRFGHVGPIKSVNVSLRFALHGVTVLRRFNVSRLDWDNYIVPLHQAYSRACQAARLG
jgi:hypothetical protein